MSAPEAFDYYAYLASEEWQLRREEVIKRAGNVCERCQERPVQHVHHLTYERLGREPLKDLQGLCRPCHAFVSGVSNTDPLDGGEPIYLTNQEIIRDWTACACYKSEEDPCAKCYPKIVVLLRRKERRDARD